MRQHPTCSSCNSTACFVNRYVGKECKEQLALNKTVQHYKAGAIVFKEGDPVTGIYYIFSGKAKVYNTGPDDRSQIVRLANSGNILGHRGLGLGLSVHYPISAATLEDSIICFIRTNDFLAALEKSPAFAINLLMFYAEELRRAEYKLRSLSQMTVRQKLADAILTVREIYGTQLHNRTKVLAVKLSRQDYADIIGASIEEVIRTFSQFKKEGILHSEGKYIAIQKEKELHKMMKGFRDIHLP